MVGGRRAGIEKGCARRDWYSDMVMSEVRIRLSMPPCSGEEVKDSAGKMGRLKVWRGICAARAWGVVCSNIVVVLLWERRSDDILFLCLFVCLCVL